MVLRSGWVQEGPISQESLLGMLQQRRLTPETLVWRDGMRQWTPASQVADLATGLAVSSGPAPMLAQPQPGLAYAQPPQANSMALTSMILGICSLVIAGIFTAIPAIICGHIARRQIREAAGMQSGDGMALAGLVIGYLVTVLTAVVLIVIVVFLIFIANAAPSSSGPMIPPSAPVPVSPGGP